MKTIFVDAVGTFIVEDDNKFEISQGMFNLLERYVNKKIILTNANDKQIEEFGLNKAPYEFFTLKHNPDKIDPEYFKILLEKFSLNKNEVIYFEHNIYAVKSAQSIGINAYFYDENKKDLESLKKFLDENLK